jgi:hypothetical protein
VKEELDDDNAWASAHIDKESIRAMPGSIRQKTSHNGKALFHPIRIALTGEADGLELDIAVPAMERGAQLDASRLRRIPSAAQRAAAFRNAL